MTIDILNNTITKLKEREDEINRCIKDGELVAQGDDPDAMMESVINVVKEYTQSETELLEKMLNLDLRCTFFSASGTVSRIEFNLTPIVKECNCCASHKGDTERVNE